MRLLYQCFCAGVILANQLLGIRAMAIIFYRHSKALRGMLLVKHTGRAIMLNFLFNLNTHATS